ncbi:MAG: hypothetical protein DIU52_006935 [bacterium]|jgi:hypothetical protein|nr:MAG: hypothetical protein DIU52_02205 [bacterium]
MAEERPASDVRDPAADDTPDVPDVTLGGYLREHGRPPAFEGCDGQPYSVDVAVDETGDPDFPFAAYFLFLRWSSTGQGIIGHIESGDVARGRTEAEARDAALALTLYEIKAELDATIARRSEVEE